MWSLVGKELNAKNMLSKCFRNASKKYGLLTKREGQDGWILAFLRVYEPRRNRR